MPYQITIIFTLGGLDYISPVLDRNISTGGRECFSISILDDSIQEDVEQFIVFLDSPNPVRLETCVAIIEIVDDDESKCTRNIFLTCLYILL